MRAMSPLRFAQQIIKAGRRFRPEPACNRKQMRKREDRMHVIPQSWSHLHMLVSVFPSVGLVFVLGLFVAAQITRSELMARSSLVALAILGLLAIPTFASGLGSMTALTGNPRISPAAMDTHYYVGLLGLIALLVMGAAAGLELWRLRQGGGPSSERLSRVLALAALTFVLMVVVGEFGWEINSPELRLDPATQTTGQGWSHVHIILNHFPTVGFVIGLCFYITALLGNDDAMKRACLALFVICAVLGVPTYVTGNASMWQLTRPALLGISQALINEHRDMALMTLFGLGLTGGAAWIELWRYRYLGRFSSVSLSLVLVFALVTLAIMAETGHRGGQINHPEIRLATDILPTDPKAGWSPAIELWINQVIWFVPWQTLHFFGYSLIFGSVLVVVLRVLGFGKAASFPAVHRLLPIGFFGVVMNVFSGMLILQADSSRYLNEYTFVPKVTCIAVGAIAVLYFSLSDKVWNVKAGEDAPMSAKAVAVLVLLAWAGVITGGRLLPYV
jgi:uncharacterized membrane protein